MNWMWGGWEREQGLQNSWPEVLKAQSDLFLRGLAEGRALGRRKDLGVRCGCVNFRSTLGIGWTCQECDMWFVKSGVKERPR